MATGKINANCIKAGQAIVSFSSSADASTWVGFDSPMPSSNYSVSLTHSSGNTSYTKGMKFSAYNFTENGFMIKALFDTSITADRVIHWIAVLAG